MHIKRDLEDKILHAAAEYYAIAIVGPRQSGKTTLSQSLFPQHQYISLEDLDVRERAHTDSRAFLDNSSGTGIILDEIQHAPFLLSYIQTIVDREKKYGYFIITGSQNFLVDQAITQTLAGRMAVITLLPFSINELQRSHILPAKIETLIYKGSYPRAHAQNISIERLYTNYIRLYIERDVRQIRNVSDLHTFQKFMRLCAGRIGQEVNFSSLSNDCGINQHTVKTWLSILEASYVIFLLYPYYRNFGKRLIKSPKLFFVDTGIACSLLNISSPEMLTSHYLRGSLVESFIISDIRKQYYNNEQDPRIYFWRDQSQHEVDCIIDTADIPIAVSIKSAQTIARDFFNELSYWQKMINQTQSQQFLIYTGSHDQTWSHTQVLTWQSAGTLIKKIEKN